MAPSGGPSWPNWKLRLQAAETELSRLRQQVEADRAEHLERLRQSARFQNDAIS